MAEVVGIAAAGVAFAEVLVKISALKHMRDKVKEMPDTVKKFVDEIELLCPIIQRLETELTSLGPDGLPWGDDLDARLVASCRHALDTLSNSIEEVSEELNSAKRSKRAMIKGKLVLQQDFWTIHEKNLQRVKDILQSAEHQWNRSVSRCA